MPFLTTLEKIAKILTPFVVATGTWLITEAIASREGEVKMLDIAIGVLGAERQESKVQASLRQWAVDVVNSTDYPLPDDVTAFAKENGLGELYHSTIVDILDRLETDDIPSGK